MYFTPNFVGKLRSSSQAKFVSFGAVGLVIRLQINVNKVKTVLNEAKLISLCLLLKCNYLRYEGTPHHRQMVSLASGLQW